MTPTKIYSFSDLELGGSVKTKDVKVGNVNKAEWDGLEAASYSCSVPLDASLGVDVQKEVKRWMQHMRKGTRSNLLIGGQDIFGVPFLLKKCEAKKVRLAGNGTWLRATLELDFEETTAATAASSTGGSSVSGSGGNGGNSSGGSKSSVSTTTRLPMTGASAKSTSIIAAHHASGNSAYAKNSSDSSSLSGAIGGYEAVKSVISSAKAVQSTVKSGSVSSATKASASAVARATFAVKN